MNERAPDAPERHAWIAPVVLAALVVLAYAPSLGAGFLGYDDDWLIERSPVMHDASASALAAIVGDFSRETRLVLGAEYLPVRDLVTWASVRVLGASAPGLRLVQLAIYVAAVLAFRAWLRRLLGPGLPAEIAALALALHPVHAESVAWLAGIKDVLALLFSGLALAVHAGPAHARRRGLVALFVLLACFSKAVCVVLPLLLVLSDAWMARPLDRVTLGITLALAALAAIVHASVGAVVGMYAPMPGGSRLAAAATMAPVAFRYALRTVLLEPASVVYEVPDRTISDPIALASAAGLVALAAAALLLFRRGERRPLLLLLFVAVALAPVSQVLAPIQHRMADRYLLVALAAPCIGLGIAGARLPSDRLRLALGAALALGLGIATADRAATFADPIALFSETTARAPSSPLGPYQLGVIVQRRDPRTAELAFREALDRDAMRTDVGRSAADDLAILLAGSGRAGEAITLLEATHARYPHDPRVAHNLAVLLDDRGEHERARTLLVDVMREHPRYARAWQSYRARFGEPPFAPPTPSRYDAGARSW